MTCPFEFSGLNCRRDALPYFKRSVVRTEDVCTGRLKGGAMPFVKIKGMKGKLYVPEVQSGRRKKHPCPDCYACDGCSDDRQGLSVSKSPNQANKSRLTAMTAMPTISP